MSPRMLRNGLLLIYIGVIFLLINLDYVNWDFWRPILRLWPLLLIAIGLEKILLAAKLRPVAYLAPVGLMAVLTWVAWVNYPRYARGGEERVARMVVEPTPEYRRVRLNLDVSRPDIVLEAASNHVLNAECDYLFHAPELSTETSDSMLTLTLKEHDRFFAQAGPFFFPRNEWDVALTDALPLELTLTCNHADHEFDFRQFRLTAFTYRGRKGDLKLCVGDRVPQVTITLDAPKVECEIGVPEQAGVRVKCSRLLSDRLLEKNGLQKEGDFYTTTNYAKASPKIEIDLGGGVGDFRLRTGECPFTFRGD